MRSSPTSVSRSWTRRPLIVRARSRVQGTRHGVIVGTIAYMSPEQAAAKPLDARSDIFSFGVVLYELLAGRRPFVGASDLEVLQQILHGAPQPLPEAIPPPLRAIVEKALEKDPADRYQSMREMVVDLRRVARQRVDGSTTAAATSGSAASKSPRAASRWPWAAVLILAALAGFGAVVVAATKQNGRQPAGERDNSPDSQISTAPRTTRPSRATDGSSSSDPIATGPWTRGSARSAAAGSSTSRMARRSTVVVRNAGFTPDGADIWLSGIIGGDRARLVSLLGGSLRPFLPEHAMNPAWSPDGSRVVFHLYDSGDPTFVAERDGSNPRELFKLEPGVHSHFPIWSRDGQWIYSVRGVWDAREMDIWRIPVERRYA